MGAPAGHGSGLTATSYRTRDFTGAARTRTDATINFDWQRSAPDAVLPNDDFSVRWTGQLAP